MREVLVVSWFRDSGAAREEGALRTTSDLPRGLQETLLIEGVADGKLFPAGESMSTLTCGFGSSFAMVRDGISWQLRLLPGLSMKEVEVVCGPSAPVREEPPRPRLESLVPKEGISHVSFITYID